MPNPWTGKGNPYTKQEVRDRLQATLSQKKAVIGAGDLRKLVHGEDSDLFDVLKYIAYEKSLIPRLQRAERAKIQLHDYNPKQQEFLNFVLDQYVREGVAELDDAKLPDLLELKYKAIADAKRELGAIKTIRESFIGFQSRLYDGEAS
jgi:type I restriction enzyme R subunit